MTESLEELTYHLWQQPAVIAGQMLTVELTGQQALASRVYCLKREAGLCQLEPCAFHACLP